MPKHKVKLQYVPDDKDVLNPLLMSFPAGLLPSSHLSNDDETGMRVELRRNAKKRSQYEVCAETDTMSYTATNFGPTMVPRSRAHKFLVGVHHKGSGAVRLVTAQQLFHMQPKVKQPRLALEPAEPRAGLQGAAAKRNLVTELGSAKAQKKQKSELAKQISPEAVFNSANLSADLASLAQVEVPKPLTPQQARPLHPPFNLAAATPLDAYPREGLIPQRAWDALDVAPVLANLKNDAELGRMQQSELWPTHVLAQLRALPDAKQARRAAAKQLLYLAYMVRFHGMRRPLRPHDEGEAHPEAKRRQIGMDSWAQLVADFTEAGRPGKGGGPGAASGTRELTPALRQKLIMHILALALHVGSGTLDAAALAGALELTPERLCFFLRQLGCSIKTSGSGESKRRIAVLTVPLTFPRASQGPPARK